MDCVITARRKRKILFLAVFCVLGNPVKPAWYAKRHFVGFGSCWNDENFL